MTHDEIERIADALTSAAEDWLNAAENVATAISDLEEIEPDDLPARVRSALAFRCNGFEAWRKKAAELEPDRNPPEAFAELAEIFADAING